MLSHVSIACASNGFPWSNPTPITWYSMQPKFWQPLILTLFLVLLASCDSASEQETEFFDGRISNVTCNLPAGEITSGAARDGIMALTDTPMISAEAATYLIDEDRVLGFIIDGQPYAVPQSLFWFHEIMNLNLPSIQLAVTYCPLTGTGLLFDRKTIQGNEFGVSGLLYNNNLIMYDRTSNESLWPQMSRRAECGPQLGVKLIMHPVIELRWEHWKAIYPETLVASNDTGFGFNYRWSNYPYAGYNIPENDALLFDMPIDPRRLPKELVLGVPDNRLGGIAIPLAELENGEPVNVARISTPTGPAVIFWNQKAQGAMAYRTTLDGQDLEFIVRDDSIVDTRTGSTWQLDGLAVSGQLAGARLEPIAEAYLSFWFAWAAFHPETQIWES